MGGDASAMLTIEALASLQQQARRRDAPRRRRLRQLRLGLRLLDATTIPRSVDVRMERQRVNWGVVSHLKTSRPARCGGVVGHSCLELCIVCLNTRVPRRRDTHAATHAGYAPGRNHPKSKMTVLGHTRVQGHNFA